MQNTFSVVPAVGLDPYSYCYTPEAVAMALCHVRFGGESYYNR